MGTQDFRDHYPWSGISGSEEAWPDLACSMAPLPPPFPRLHAQVPCRIDQPGSDKNNQVALDVLVHRGAEECPNRAEVAQAGDLCPCTFCTSSRIKSADHHCLPSQTLTLVVTLRVSKIGWLIRLP